MASGLGSPAAEAGGEDPIREHHGEIVGRLRRIEGQVSGIYRMYEGSRYCIDVLDQISAARAGLEAAALLILEDHVNGCVTEALEGGKGPTEGNRAAGRRPPVRKERVR